MAQWIPFLQTLVWLTFITVLIVLFRLNFTSILQAIAERIKSGAPIEAGPAGFKIGTIPKEMEKLPDAPQKNLSSEKAPLPQDWRQNRSDEYARVDGYMLAHVYRPSTASSQKYDIFLFLVRHQQGTDGPPRHHFDEIEKAEFFFGESWGNQIFTAPNTGGVIGVRTRACPSRENIGCAWP